MTAAKTVVILQPNYIPWKGYFDLIAACDLFVLYEDVQFTKNDWRNRNVIKTPKGLEWLTIPVGSKHDRLVRDVKIPDIRWQKKHWKTLQTNYSRARFSREIFDLLEPIYLFASYSTLISVNRTFIEVICSYLDIETEIRSSSEFPPRPSGSEGVLELCKSVCATRYISGPAARNYLVEKDFVKAGINVCWYDYCDYPEYPQLWGAFEHKVTVLDVLFNCGKTSRNYLKFHRS